jgi:TolA-binding protein
MPEPSPVESAKVSPSASATATAATVTASATGPARAAPARARAPRATGEDAQQSLYDAAHAAHFVAHDPGEALRAWDAYLGVYPNGRFALEARYNRALALVRLGRTDEARSALGPFAAGIVGGYRQREALDLLDALDARRP